MALEARLESLEAEVASGLSTMRQDIANVQSSVNKGIAELQSRLDVALQAGAKEAKMKA